MQILHAVTLQISDDNFTEIFFLVALNMSQQMYMCHHKYIKIRKNISFSLLKLEQTKSSNKFMGEKDIKLAYLSFRVGNTASLLSLTVCVNACSRVY